MLLDESILDGVQDRGAQGSGCVVVVAAVDAAVGSWMVDRLEEGGEVHVAAAFVRDGRGALRIILQKLSKSLIVVVVHGDDGGGGDGVLPLLNRSDGKACGDIGGSTDHAHIVH